jgi:hypothetical protein
VAEYKAAEDALSSLRMDVRAASERLGKAQDDLDAAQNAWLRAAVE